MIVPDRLHSNFMYIVGTTHRPRPNSTTLRSPIDAPPSGKRVMPANAHYRHSQRYAELLESDRHVCPKAEHSLAVDWQHA